MTQSTSPIWTPSTSRARSAQVHQFARSIAERHGRVIDSMRDLHRWSIEEPAAFWRDAWSWFGLRGDAGNDTVHDLHAMMHAEWFPQARLNFAENLLLGSKHEATSRDSIAMIACAERGTLSTWTFGELRDEVQRVANALRVCGITTGDRIAGFVTNGPYSVIYMLAAASIGATWSSCSTDFGAQGVLDRFEQIEPKLLVAVTGTVYSGRYHDIVSKVEEVVSRLPTLEHCVFVPHFESDAPAAPVWRDVIGRARVWAHAAFVEQGVPERELEFEQLPFNHPLFVLFSSGTTGKPKCIVHGAGGTLIQHIKEHRFHVDLRAHERIFYFTTCGWMMWNWLVTALASRATIVLYEGSPVAPSSTVMFDMVDRERVEVFGTSAKFIDSINKLGIRPCDTHSLVSLRSILSTGSPLVAEAFDYVYRDIKSDVALASISGGTDIVSCFVTGDPTQSVFRGEIQCAGLGMDVQVWNDQGERVVGERGELVCATAFPSQPIAFWNDPEGVQYKRSYFDRFDGVWCHGDFCMETEHGGYVIDGRSDATLNPGGVRIGTAEIYRLVEQFPEVIESVAIGQPWNGDVRIVLFVVMATENSLTNELRQRIQSDIRLKASPRHVPAIILEAHEIPRTRSGKISELAVKRAVLDEPINNTHALANPEALEHFRDRAELFA